jgi:cell filamentation protein
LWQTDTFREALSEKLTDKQKSRLWEQQRNVNFQASCRLEKGNGPSAPIETLAWAMRPGCPICAHSLISITHSMERAGKYRRVDIFKGDILFCHLNTSRKRVTS